MEGSERRRALRAVQGMATEDEEKTGQRSPVWDQVPLDRQVALYHGMKLVLPAGSRLSRKMFHGWLVAMSTSTKIRRKFWVVPTTRMAELIQAGRVPADAVVHRPKK